MSDILDEIVARKRADLSHWRRERPLAGLLAAARSAPSPRGFAQALRTTLGRGEFGLIAEIKQASPSHGLIRPGFDPAVIARAYRAGGATCLSVLTDAPYFQGSPEHLAAARAVVELPILRKDFMIDPWQVVEARTIAADCILLILACLSDDQAAELEAAAVEFGLDVLAEVHDAAELDRALRLRTRLIGINNRNLKTLTTDLQTTIELAARVPADRLVISESGLRTRADLDRMEAAGARCFLVGESLLRQADVEAATRQLLGVT
jgi:indole-3-glycerol phosphate synthase